MQLTFDERYAETLLASGERIIRNQRQHWLGLVARWGLGVVLILVGLAVMTASGWVGGDGFFGTSEPPSWEGTGDVSPGETA